MPAGSPSPAEDYLETPLDLTEYLIENKAATFLMRVDGDSMKDAGILDGDLLVVDRAAKPVNGSVVVVAVNGEYTVKRLRRGSDCVWLDPANPRYQPLRVSLGEELHVFGVVSTRFTRCDEIWKRSSGSSTATTSTSPASASSVPISKGFPSSCSRTTMAALGMCQAFHVLQHLAA